MNGCDAICFTGGIGENSPEVRRQICANLENLGIEIDDILNQDAIRGKEMLISTKSKIAIYVIPQMKNS